MKDSQNLPLEKKQFKIEINGTTKLVPALDKAWVEISKRNFSRYIAHPVPVNGNFLIGEKETWCEIASFVIEDLKWLLQQKHHIFWSHMVYSKQCQQLLITFLQEAPPFYLRNEFPNDGEMQKCLAKIEHLVFLVYVRLSTEKESDSHYIQNLGELLYDNYLFTVPIFLDICLIYGIRNRHLVAKMFDDVISVAPQYLKDFQEIVDHFIHVLGIVRSKYEVSVLDKSISKLKEMKDVILYLYDSAANIQIFLEIYSNGSKIFRTDSFLVEVSSFYSSVIPKIYKYLQQNKFDLLNNFKVKIDVIRLNLLSIVRSMFCGIINSVLNDPEYSTEHGNEYLATMIEVLQESLFLSDYNRIYPIDADLKLLKDMCPEIDSENLKYISETVTSYENKPKTNQLDMDCLISKVKDILPYLGDGFVETCIKFYNFDTERVITAILENTLHPDLEILDRNMRKRTETSVVVEERKIIKNQEMIELFNDKTELNELREKITNIDYEDEYDDTYDDRDAALRDDDDQERKPIVTPRKLAESEESEEEETGNKGNDYFVENPAEIRARQEQKRMQKVRRDYVGRGKGHGQDKQVIANRNYKDTHKSSIANHNRRKLASRKRNIPLVYS